MKIIDRPLFVLLRGWIGTSISITCAIITIFVLIFFNEYRPRKPDFVSVKPVDYATCVEQANVSDGAIEKCATQEIVKIRAMYSQLMRNKLAVHHTKTEPAPFDDDQWNKYVIEHCQSEIRDSTNVPSYEIYGTMERMLYEICEMDQTELRFESLTGQTIK
jgi:hypothetical protein